MLVRILLLKVVWNKFGAHCTGSQELVGKKCISSQLGFALQNHVRIPWWAMKLEKCYFGCVYLCSPDQIIISLRIETIIMNVFIYQTFFPGLVHGSHCAKYSIHNEYYSHGLAFKELIFLCWGRQVGSTLKGWM